MSQRETDTTRAPVRIEMATSEIEGGSCVAWTDPDRLVGIVANSSPRGAFEKYLLPNLITQQPVSDGSAPALPPSARMLLAALENTHKRLYRENKSVMKDPNWIQVLCGVIEGQQLHLVGCGRVWAFVIRGGRAHLLESDEVGDAPQGKSEADAELPAAVGRDSSLRLRVLTLDLTPNDDVVLVTTNDSPPPDLRAVATAFHRIQDVKRGCDGIVNLQASRGSAGSCVAFRLVPVAAGASGSRSEAGEELLEELVAEVESLGEALDRPRAAAPRPETSSAPSGGEAAGGKASPVKLPQVKAPEVRRALPTGVPANARTWQPSYARKTPARIPILVWIAIIMLVSLAGVVTFYKPGWTGLLEGIQEIWEGTVGSEGSGGADLSAAGLQAKMGTADASSAETRASVAAGFSQGVGLVRVHPRAASLGAQAWIESSGERRDLPADFTLPAGWTRVFYEDDSVALWSQEALVQAGETTHVHVHSAPSENLAFLRVEAFHMEEGRGFFPADGDSIFLDSELIGLTPWEEEITPGWHSLRVAATDGWQAIEVFSIKEGQSRFFSPRLGLQAFSTFEHVSPGRVLLNGPILLSVRIEPPADETVRQPLLLVLSDDGAAEEIPLAPVDPSKGLFVGAVDPEHVHLNEAMRYCFSCLTEGGTPSTSEIFTLTPVNDLSERLQP